MKGPQYPQGLWTTLGGDREPLRVLKQGRQFIRVALLNINLMLCAGQIQRGRSWRQLWNPRERWQVPALWLKKQTNSIREHAIIGFSFVLKVHWAFPQFVRQELQQVFIWHPTHFQPTHSDKLILELKIITGLPVEMEGNVPKTEKEGDRADYSLSFPEKSNL